MRRLDNERGAVAVLMAILMVALIGFAAIGVDVANMASDKQQLQNGADAAALAIAEACAAGDCGLYEDVARDLAEANRHDSSATAKILNAPLTPDLGKVEVRTTGVTNHWFAPLFELLGPGRGTDSTEIQAKATAEWGWPMGGTSLLPLAIHKCQFDYQVALQGGDISSAPQLVTIVLPKDLDAAEKHADPGQVTYPIDFACTLPEGVNPVPGGFGWLEPDSAGSCQATSFFGTFFGSDPGKDLPCPASEIEKMQDQTVLIPLYDDYDGSGQGAWYDVMGYAAFTLKGYEFVGSGTPSWGVPCPKTINVCISGYFEEFVDISSAFDYAPSAPDYGAAVVKLTG